MTPYTRRRDDKAPSQQGTGLSVPRYHPYCTRVPSRTPVPLRSGTGPARPIRYPLPVNGGRSVCAYSAAGPPVGLWCPGIRDDQPARPPPFRQLLPGELRLAWNRPASTVPGSLRTRGRATFPVHGVSGLVTLWFSSTVSRATRGRQWMQLPAAPSRVLARILPPKERG